MPTCSSRRVPPALFGNFPGDKKMQRHFPARIAMLAALVTTVPHWAQAQGGHWGEGYFPNLPVVTQDGKTARFYAYLLKPKGAAGALRQFSRRQENATTFSGAHRHARGTGDYRPALGSSARRPLGGGLLPQPAGGHTGRKDGALL